MAAGEQTDREGLGRRRRRRRRMDSIDVAEAGDARGDRGHGHCQGQHEYKSGPRPTEMRGRNRRIHSRILNTFLIFFNRLLSRPTEIAQAH